MERRNGRVVAIALAGALLVAGLVVSASAVSSVKVALHQKRDLQERIDQLHETRRVRRVALHKRIRFTKARLRNTAGAASVVDRGRSWRYRQRQLDRLDALRAEERRVIKSVRGRVRELQSRRGELADWIDSLPFERCPVAGSPIVSDNFGVIREMPGTPRHIHQGNDIMAPTGTPIVAPFDGEAVAGSNYLGGQSVHVYGPAGYVYNAHLAAYGKLGTVRAGDVIGYVGVTGNATAPHNHFEWHPGDGAAVDPYSLLAVVC
jgi:murein DD-endopeptidase MepM/ murein hydrolase activator NlpD